MIGAYPGRFASYNKGFSTRRRSPEKWAHDKFLDRDRPLRTPTPDGDEQQNRLSSEEDQKASTSEAMEMQIAPTAHERENGPQPEAHKQSSTNVGGRCIGGCI